MNNRQYRNGSATTGSTAYDDLYQTDSPLLLVFNPLTEPLYNSYNTPYDGQQANARVPPNKEDGFERSIDPQ
jgi:hypothetical protein